MVPEDLLFWVDTFHPADGIDSGVLCRRHADAMVVPRGWTLDDRREPHPRLFRSPADASGSIARPKRRRSAGSASLLRERVEQLELEAAEIEASRPTAASGIDRETGDDPDIDPDPIPGLDDHTDAAVDGPATPWAPVFDSDDDLDGLLHVDSPLLARAFRGTDRAR
jgi:hypothetical protein